MFESDKKSPLDRLKKGLYSRKTMDVGEIRHPIHDGTKSVAESWDGGMPSDALATPTAVAPIAPILSPRHKGIYKVFFLASGLFFVIALALAAYTFLGGGNYVSVDNVDILIEGPASIAGGEPLALSVSVLNKNNTDMQLVDLIAEYPQGSKDPRNPAQDLSRVRVSLGDIKTQSSAQETLTSLLFGEEGTQRDITFTAEYRTADSNAIFFKEKTYKVTISSSPILVAVDTLEKVTAGDSFDVTVTVSSNSTSVIKDVLLSLDYPFGFSVISSLPAATYGDTIWYIGDLAPGAKKKITLHASASGQDGEQRAIHANVGIQSRVNSREIATTIISREHTFTIEKPFLGLDLTLDGNRSGLVAEAGKQVRAEIIWTNNSPAKITGAKITAVFSGNVLDKNTIYVGDGGYYDSLTNSVIWEAGRTDGLATIAPGDTGRVSVSFYSSRSTSGQAIANPQITLSVKAEGGRIDESGVSEIIKTGVSQTVKLVSNLALSSRLLFSQGPLPNTGSIPPHVDKPTTYTVVFTASNTSNTITGAKVTAHLPPYVKWTGLINPPDANITYDPVGGAITWIAGEIPRNSDTGVGAKQVSFQVSFTPSANQVGTAPEIVSAAAITGTDVFTGATLQNSTRSLSTRISTDLIYKSGDELVQQ